MNTEVTRNFFTKLLACCLVMGAVSYFFVGPKMIQASDLQSSYQMQTLSISEGEQEIKAHADAVSDAMLDMQTISRQVIEDLTIDKDVQAHQLLQHSAVANGLTVTRVEPLRSAFSEVKTGYPEQIAKIEEKEFRIECQGPYGGIVTFIEEMQAGPGRTSIENFRIIATDAQSVSAIMTVKLVELIEVPQQLRMMPLEAVSAEQSTPEQGANP